MDAKPVIQIISGVPPKDPEVAKKYYKWVRDRHVPDMFKYKGMKKATTYMLIPETDPEFATNVDYPKEITIFEFYTQKDKEAYKDSPELKAAIEDGLATFPADIGYTKFWNATYKEVQTCER